MRPLVVISGPTVTGKTTVGRLLAKRLHLRHLEMSEFALAEKLTYELAESPISTLDYVEKVLWGGHDWDIVVRQMSDFLLSDGLVVTGPRRVEEVEALVGLRSDADLVYLHVPLDIRVTRALKDATKRAPPEVLVARTEREASWGLLDRPFQLPFRLVSNAGTLEQTIAEIAAPHEVSQWV